VPSDSLPRAGSPLPAYSSRKGETGTGVLDVRPRYRSVGSVAPIARPHWHRDGWDCRGVVDRDRNWYRDAGDDAFHRLTSSFGWPRKGLNVELRLFTPPCSGRTRRTAGTSRRIEASADRPRPSARNRRRIAGRSRRMSRMSAGEANRPAS